MSKTLPKAWSLITETWSDFKTHWNETFKISIWFLYLGLVAFCWNLLVKFHPSLYGGLLNAILFAAVFIASLWTAIRLYQVVFEIEQGKKILLDREASWSAARLILPIIGLAILQFAVILGGTILFIIPGIYLSIALTFTSLIRIEGTYKGFQTMAASRALVKGRWWTTAWLSFAGNFFFGFGLALITGLVMGLLAALSGNSAFINGVDSSTADPLIHGAVVLLQRLFQSAVMPLFMFYQVKLYRALKATQDKTA